MTGPDQNRYDQFVDVYEHHASYDGIPVIEFEVESGWPIATEKVAWALRFKDEGEKFGAIFARFLATVDTAAVTHLVIGAWGFTSTVPAEVPRDLLIEAAPRLPNLKALFFGDIVGEECEISWIQLCDLTPLLDAYPGLERLDVRGGAPLHEGSPSLTLSPLSHGALRILRFESGGLPGSAVRSLGACDFPRLETLDLWLGMDNYGGDTAVADLAGILAGDRLPALRRLGLMNSEIQDEICAALAAAPVVARLTELDLSLGALTDDGAEALLSGQPLTHLARLTVEHHFLTGPMAARLREALPGGEVLINEPQPESRWGAYIAVAE